MFFTKRVKKRWMKDSLSVISPRQEAVIYLLFKTGCLGPSSLHLALRQLLLSPYGVQVVLNDRQMLNKIPPHSASFDSLSRLQSLLKKKRRNLKISLSQGSEINITQTSCHCSKTWNGKFSKCLPASRRPSKQSQCSKIGANLQRLPWHREN